MHSKPLLIKLKNIETLLGTILSGNLYTDAVLPLLHGEIVRVTNNTVTIAYESVTFNIRTDQPIHTDMQAFVDLLQQQINAYIKAGAKIFKDLTDINSLALALETENTFSRNGITCTTRKISDDVGDDKSFKMVYKLTSEFMKKNVTTSNEDEVLIFLGSLARQYSINMQHPDANWYKDEDERLVKQVQLGSGDRHPSVALVAGSTAEVYTAKE